MIDRAVALYANEAFYLAFNNRDLGAMDGLWAKETSAVCIHPGWTPLFNRSEIMQSWRDIFLNENAQPTIVCHEPRVLYQGDVISVVCYEQLAGGWLVATNGFVQEEDALRVFHHQAGQCVNPPELTVVDKPTVQ